MKDFFKKIVMSALTFEAQILLNRRKPKIVAITGSVGKTSTKDAVFTVLKERVHARKSEKSFNSDIGVALTILGLRGVRNNPLSWIRTVIDGALHAVFSREYPDVLILEMGVDRKGDMARLTSWIKPDVVVVTRLADVPAHVEFFSSPQEVAEEKMSLVSALKPEGVFVFNNDDQLISEYKKGIQRQSFGFGVYNTSHFSALNETVLYDGALPTGMQFFLSHVGEETVRATVVKSLGKQHMYTYAAAAAVGSVFGISLKEAVDSLGLHASPQGRMRLIDGVQGSVIIDDTYNSSPTACENALLTLHELKVAGKKVAILGDMLELGRFSVREHERIGEFLASKIDVLITVGVRARKIAESAHAYGLQSERIIVCDNAQDVVEKFLPSVQKNDVILVKASQSIRAEKIVMALMKDKEKSSELLVRQNSMWK